MVTYAARPSDVDGCWSTWSEQDQPMVVRSQMDQGAPKVRRRFTGLYRLAQVSVTIASDKLPAWQEWFRLNCLQGVLPTPLKEPSGVESIWRFIEAPVVEWGEPGSNLVRFSARIERLPGWQEL